MIQPETVTLKSLLDVTTPVPVKGCDVVRFEYDVNEALFDDYTLVNGAELVEENIMTWYATAGTFTDDPAKETRNGIFPPANSLKCF